MSGKSLSFHTIEGLFEEYRLSYDPARLVNGRFSLLLCFRRYLEEAELTEPSEPESVDWHKQRLLLEQAYRDTERPYAADHAASGGCGEAGEGQAPLFRSGCAACMSKGGCGI